VAHPARNPTVAMVACPATRNPVIASNRFGFRREECCCLLEF